MLKSASLVMLRVAKDGKFGGGAGRVGEVGKAVKVEDW